MAAGGIIIFLGMEGRNRGVVETGVEAVRTGMERRVLVLNRYLEEETEIVVVETVIRTGMEEELSGKVE